ncbi:unnamed protein product [Haemonchus placei]|uniref:Glucuronosyltransferase n=1 Tax=Haemonchus placei TaxID=6290 RepID=A0A0N4W902_HAEPC|nr:unnamed protein product [Haemonchus placei]
MNALEIDWPSAPFQCFTDYSVLVSNCIVFHATISTYHAAISANPTIAMRNILERSDIEAKFLGNNIVRT